MKRYESTPVSRRWDGKRVYGITHYPTITPSNDDTFIISSDGDYLDNLAHKYYGDPTLWWVIALANNIGKGRLSVTPGLQLRLPANINNIITEFHSLNKK